LAAGWSVGSVGSSGWKPLPHWSDGSEQVFEFLVDLRHFPVLDDVVLEHLALFLREHLVLNKREISGFLAEFQLIIQFAPHVHRPLDEYHALALVEQLEDSLGFGHAGDIRFVELQP